MGFLAQKLLIHRKRSADDQAKDILYIHDTLQVFGARLDGLRIAWTDRVRPSLHRKAVKEIETASDWLFGEMTDVIREAAGIAPTGGCVPRVCERAAGTDFSRSACPTDPGTRRHSNDQKIHSTRAKPGQSQIPDFLERNRLGTEEANLDFLVNNHQAITSLSDSSGVPATWIFGWAVAETGYGTALAARVNHNHFGMSKGGNWTGQIACPAGASDRWACFSTFAASADAALNSSRLDLNTEGRFNAASYIRSLFEEDPATPPERIFQDIAERNHDPGNPLYGTRVRETISGVSRRLDCLSKNGYM